MHLPSPFIEDSDHVNVIIETPKGSRNKYSFDTGTRLFKLKKVLPAGASFPFDFGFIPGTKAEDGDPLDVLLMMQHTTYPGCLVESRIIGMLEFEQHEPHKKVITNNRLVGLPLEDHDYPGLKHIKNLSEQWLNELIGFMQYYNRMEGRKLRFLGLKGPSKSIHYIQHALSEKP